MIGLEEPDTKRRPSKSNEVAGSCNRKCLGLGVPRVFAKSRPMDLPDDSGRWTLDRLIWALVAEPVDLVQGLDPDVLTPHRPKAERRYISSTSLPSSPGLS